MVDGGGILHGLVVGAIPACVEHIVAGRRGLVEEQEAEVRGAAADEEFRATDGLVRRSRVAGAALRLVVDHEAPVAHVA